MRHVISVFKRVFLCCSLNHQLRYLPTSQSYSLQFAHGFHILSVTRNQYVLCWLRREEGSFFSHSTNVRSEVTYTMYLVVELNLKDKSSHALFTGDRCFPCLHGSVVNRVKGAIRLGEEADISTQDSMSDSSFLFCIRLVVRDTRREEVASPPSHIPLRSGCSWDDGGVRTSAGAE